MLLRKTSKNKTSKNKTSNKMFKTPKKKTSKRKTSKRTHSFGYPSHSFGYPSQINQEIIDKLDQYPIKKAKNISWLLYAIKETLGTSDVRNHVIRHYSNMFYDKTPVNYEGVFTRENGPNDYNNFIKDIICRLGGTNCKIVFSVENAVGTGEPEAETHYQSFVFHAKDRKLVCIDPSYLKSYSEDLYSKYYGEGIYNPAAIEKTNIYIFENCPSVSIEIIDLTNPCQIIVNDVFCQSWSLYLQIKHLITNEMKIDIPEYLVGKSALLITFFKQLLDIQKFKDTVQLYYNQNMKDPKYKKFNIKELDTTTALRNLEIFDLYEPEAYDAELENRIDEYNDSVH